MKKKQSLVIGFLVMMLCVAMLFSGCSGISAKSVSKNPDEQVLKSMQKTLDAFIGSNSPITVLSGTATKGSVALELEDMVENTLYFDTENQHYVNKLNLFDEYGSELNFDVFYKDKEVALSIPEMFGEGHYGVDLDSFKEDLKDSILLELSETDYDSFMEEYEDALNEFLNTLDSFSKKDYAAFEDLSKELDAFMEDIEVTVEKSEIEMNGNTVDAINVAYIFTSDDVSDLLDIIFDWYEDQVEVYSDLLNSDSDDALFEGESEIDFETLRSDVDDFLETIDGDCKIVFSIHPKNECVMRIDFNMTGTIDSEDASINASVVFGEDPTESNNINASIVFTADGKDLEFNLDYEKEESDSEYKGEITFAGSFEDEEYELSVEISYDKSSGDYSLTFEDEALELTAKGEYKCSEEEFMVSIDTMKIDGEKEDLGFLLSVTLSDDLKIPDLPEYKNVLKMSEDDFMAVIEEIENSSFYAPTYPDDDYSDWEDSWTDDDDSANSDQEATTGNLSGDGTVIFDQDGITITATEIVYNDYGASIVLSIENGTDTDISFDCSYVNINGVTLYSFGYGTAAPNSTGEGYIELYADDLKITGIKEIVTLETSDAEIYNSNTYDTIFAFDFSFVTDSDYTYVLDVSGNKLYESANFTLTAKSLHESYGDILLTVLVENNTNEDVCADIGYASINGAQVDTFAYPMIYANTVSFIQIPVSSSSLNGLTIEDIESFGFDLSFVSASDGDTLEKVGYVETGIE